MSNIIIRRNNLFVIDKTKLKPKARKDDVCNALYAAIYTEFAGASYNEDYKDLSYIERLNKVNEFALNWLIKKGLN